MHPIGEKDVRELGPLIDEWAAIQEDFPAGLEQALDWVESVAEWAGEVSGKVCTYGAVDRSMRLYREREELLRRLDARPSGPGAALGAEAHRAIVDSGRFLPVETHALLIAGILGGEAAAVEADPGDPLLRLARRAQAGAEGRRASGGNERRTGP